MSFQYPNNIIKSSASLVKKKINDIKFNKNCYIEIKNKLNDGAHCAVSIDSKLEKEANLSSASENVLSVISCLAVNNENTMKRKFNGSLNDMKNDSDNSTSLVKCKDKIENTNYSIIIGNGHCQKRSKQ